MCLLHLVLKKTCHVSPTASNIVSKSLSETTMFPQMFIVKTLLIENMHSHHIYMKWKEGASVQDSGET
jgi:hypothetical protein